ncbi:helix-turn-helix domain-containing protein [Asticcacaulis sp.]|uniref:helix-turn-helix domain-containing protein n=1 Tax=Asticcacaulis sp. TaxID=1872648 RepID=UPI003F7C4357
MSETAISEQSINLHIGARLRARRELRRLSSSDLADLTGISLAELQAIEEGGAEATPKFLLRAAAALNVHVRYFFLEYQPRRIAA